MNRLARVTALALMAAGIAAAAGCAEISIFSSRHYHFHGRCGAEHEPAEASMANAPCLPEAP